MHNLSDEQQFEQFSQGNAQAFEYFYLKYHRGVHKYTFDLCRDEQLAKDITQEVFKRLWDLRTRMVNNNHLQAYLYLIARQLFFQHLRKEPRAFDAVRDLAFVAQRRDRLNEELEFAFNQWVIAVDSAMKTLSPKRRLVIYLLFVKGYDTVTVARMLGISPQTVRNTKSRALAILRGQLYDSDLLMPLVLPAMLLYIDQG